MEGPSDTPLKQMNGRPRLVRFGLFELDTASARLRKSGLRIKLQKQPLQILEALLSRPGEIVSRGEFRQVLWPAEVPPDSDHRVNKAVNKLRTALGDTADNPRFVETLAKQGYRFIAPVEVVETVSPANAPGAPSPVVPEKPRYHRWLVAAAVVLGAAGMILILVNRPPTATAIDGYHRLTNDGRQKLDGISVDRDFAYFVEFVDGVTRLARVPLTGGETSYVPVDLPSGVNIFVLDSNAATGQLLLKTGSGIDHDLGDGTLFVVSTEGGEPHRLGDIAANDAKWSPDGASLAYFTGTELWLAEANGGKPRRIADKAGTNSAIRWSPDGRRIRFRSGYPTRDHSTIWEVPVSGGDLRPVLPEWNFEQDCGAWTNGGSHFLFFSPSDSNLWIVPEGGSWFGRPPREPVRLTSGPLKFRSPRLRPDGSSLIAIGEILRGELIRWDRDKQSFEPFLSGVSIDQLDFSRDGEWMTYISFPDGQMWISRADGTGSKQLTSDPMRTYLPRLSPDNRSIAFMGRMPGERWKILLTPLAGGTFETLVPGEGTEADPNWSPDGRRIVFAPFPWEVKLEATGIRILDLETRAVEFIPGSRRLFSPRWSPDGRRIAAIRYSDSGLVVYDLEQRRWSSVTDFQGGFPAWSRDGQCIYTFHAFTENRGIYRTCVETRKVDLVASLRGIDVAGILGPYGLSLAPDGSPIVLRDDSSQEIYALDLDLH